jgi:hypothetical protein
MMGGRFAIPIVGMVLLLSCIGSGTAHAQPADLSERAHAEWILRAVMADGAIAHHVDHKAIWPYLSNFAAMGLARATHVTGDPRYAAAAWRWLRWYHDHQDASGYVTDYNVTNGVPVSTGDMDSTDAYAGTYLMAIHEAWAATGDRQQLLALRAGIVRAVKAIELTQNDDGLTWAKPSWRVKYLMDQAETFAGLKAAEFLASVLGDPGLGDRAARDAARLHAGVERLWNPGAGAYDWAVHEDGTRTATNWSLLYPDALQQPWAVAFGLVTGERARIVMDRFQRAQPNWADPTATASYSSGPRPVGHWPPVGWALQAVGDTELAIAAATSIGAAALAANRAWPFTPSDAGQLIILQSGGYLNPRRGRLGGGRGGFASQPLAGRRYPTVCGRSKRKPGRWYTRLAQRLLRKAGHRRVRVSGRCDRPTRRAVRTFQRRQQLRVNGVVNGRTWSALVAFRRPPGR